MSELRTLYPEIEPFDTGRLKVSSVHELYYEQCGNAAGKPVVFLHGGPGAGLVPEYRRFFDPAAYRVILFDQRGSGKSTPYASLEDNTTWHLVADIEQIREQPAALLIVVSRLSLDRHTIEQVRPERVDTLHALEEALVDFPGCAVVISHDRWFLDRIATHILAFEGNSETIWFEGSYRDYAEDFKKRKGADADRPHRIAYRKLVHK